MGRRRGGWRETFAEVIWAISTGDDVGDYVSPGAKLLTLNLIRGRRWQRPW